jgi:hypothetical protein
MERYTEDAKEAPDAGAQQQLLDAANQAFAGWQNIIVAALTHEGVGAARAQRLAALMLSSLEGAVALCRAALSLQPLHDVGEEVALLVQAAIQEARAA